MLTAKTIVVFRKELRDAFRDRSTIFSVLVLPLVVYPAMFIGMGLLIGQQRQDEERRTVRVAVSGPRDQGLLDLLRNDPKIAIVEPAEPRRLLESGEIHAALEFQPVRADKRLALSLLYDQANRSSVVAKERVAKLIDARRHRLVAERVMAKGLDTLMLAPLTAEYKNVASARKMGGFVMGMILPYMIVLLICVGAVHTAIDITAGEKERRTIETLLVSDISRKEIVVGKLLATVTIGMITAAMGLVSLGLTAVSGISILSARQSAPISLSFSPGAMAFSYLTLIPTAILLSSAMLLIGSFARSVREGNAYASYFMMAIIMLAMVSITPMEPSPGLFLVPVLNTALCQKELLMGIVNWGHIGPAVLTTGLLAALAFVFAVAFFQREEVLFRS